MWEPPDKEAAKKDFEPYLEFFRLVPTKGWERALAECPPWGDTTSRKRLAWNAMNIIARERAAEYGLTIIELRNGTPLPLVVVPGAEHEYRVRFNCLSEELKAGGWDTAQRRLFEDHLPRQGTLLGPLVYLRAGYVLDEFGLAIVRTPILLSDHDTPVWFFDIEDDTPPAPVITLRPPPGPEDGPRIGDEGEEEGETETGSGE